MLGCRHPDINSVYTPRKAGPSLIFLVELQETCRLFCSADEGRSMAISFLGSGMKERELAALMATAEPQMPISPKSQTEQYQECKSANVRPVSLAHRKSFCRQVWPAWQYSLPEKLSCLETISIAEPSALRGRYKLKPARVLVTRQHHRW